MDTVTADSKTIVEGLAARGNRHAVWVLAEMARLAAELAAAAEGVADLENENAFLYADLAVLSGALRLIADTSGETRIWQIATGAMANISNDD